MVPNALTRSSVQRDHALIAPDSHVPAPLPGWTKTKGIILISPVMGARFSQFYAIMERRGESAPPLPGVERFFFVLEGEATLQTDAGTTHLGIGGYGFIPAGTTHKIIAKKAAKLLLFEKKFVPLEGVALPEVVTGNERDLPESPFLGDDRALLKFLLPDNPSYDMAINIFSYMPGTTLPFVEVHVMEHGLLMLDGGGVYRLADSWYPVTEGDVIWMASYCPQWFIAGGRTPSRYIYYKDVNRDPMGDL
ncbi:(S)-ureidoglycine aminohydrolase [bacterium]|nr:(S)-ureidoglycine aminohydrolase [bacterium]